MSSSDWNLSPGDKIRRKVLHQRYGGRTQGGIGPSSLTPNILIFSDTLVGKKYGYIDGWEEDGCYHYTGEGQYGDQEMKSGNAAILNHQKEGRALRLFQGVRGEVQYLGRFQVESHLPFYTTDAREANNGPIRSVIVFRLQQSDVQISHEAVHRVLPSTDEVTFVPVEEQYTERRFIEASREPYEIERRESKLVKLFCAHLQSKGYAFQRLQVLPKRRGETDFFGSLCPRHPSVGRSKRYC
jgi:hypothetical protein